MTAVLQRVSEASVTIDGKTTGVIGRGLLILLGVARDDDESDAGLLCEKISKLRIFEDVNEKMNLSVVDIGGKPLLISNFTLLADCRHGNRPDFFGAEAPDKAKLLYESFKRTLSQKLPVESGEFGADMRVSLVNDGPVTITLDSRALTKKTVKSNEA